MNAGYIDLGRRDIFAPVDLAGERNCRHVHIGPGRGGPVWFVDHGIGEFESRVHCEDGTDVLNDI